MPLFHPLKRKGRVLTGISFSCLMCMLPFSVAQFLSPMQASTAVLNGVPGNGAVFTSELPEAHVDVRVEGNFEKPLPSSLVALGIPLFDYFAGQLQVDLDRLYGSRGWENLFDVGFGYRRKVYGGHALLGGSVSSSLNVLSCGEFKLAGLGVSFEGLIPNKVGLYAALHGPDVEDLFSPFKTPDQNHFKLELSGRILRCLKFLHHTLIDLEVHAVSCSHSKGQIDCEKAFLSGRFDTTLQPLGWRLSVAARYDLRQFSESPKNLCRAFGFKISFSNHKPLIHRLNTPSELAKARYATFLYTEKEGRLPIEVDRTLPKLRKQYHEGVQYSLPDFKMAGKRAQKELSHYKKPFGSMKQHSIDLKKKRSLQKVHFAVCSDRIKNLEASILTLRGDLSNVLQTYNHVRGGLSDLFESHQHLGAGQTCLIEALENMSRSNRKRWNLEEREKPLDPRLSGSETPLKDPTQTQWSPAPISTQAGSFDDGSHPACSDSRPTSAGSIYPNQQAHGLSFKDGHSVDGSVFTLGIHEQPETAVRVSHRAYDRTQNF